eukprot:7390037-Prymnesium_polylepis.3
MHVTEHTCALTNRPRPEISSGVIRHRASTRSRGSARAVAYQAKVLYCLSLHGYICHQRTRRVRRLPLSVDVCVVEVSYLVPDGSEERVEEVDEHVHRHRVADESFDDGVREARRNHHAAKFLQTQILPCSQHAPQVRYVVPGVHGRQAGRHLVAVACQRDLRVEGVR